MISFLSVDKKKTFCLYEASSSEAIIEAARRAGIPAETIIEVGEVMIPSGETHPFNWKRFTQQKEWCSVCPTDLGETEHHIYTL